MTGMLALSAALLLGLAASGHCLVMCGGITAALGMATAKDARGRARPMLLVGYQLGRISSYVIAGVLLASALGGLVGLLDIESVRRTLRIATALVLAVAALVAFGGLRDPVVAMGGTLWRHVAPVGRRLLPVGTLPRAFAFGMVWGWMPCGLVYTVLLVATLQGSPLGGAATMAAFGLGTAPAMLVAAFGAHRLARFAALPGARQLAGSMLLLAAGLTFAAPWIEHEMPRLHAWMPMLCGGQG
jgi:sulfite exporter TauE/SafE